MFLNPAQLPSQWVQGLNSLVQDSLNVNLTSLLKLMVKNPWTFTPVVPYMSMTCSLIKHRKNFTFYMASEIFFINLFCSLKNIVTSRAVVVQ